MGESLPALDERIAGIVIYGGAQDVDKIDEHPFLHDELKLIDAALKRETPLLGLCLGGQLMAHALGEPVHGHAEGHAEYGYYDLVPTAAGRADIRRRPHRAAIALAWLVSNAQGCGEACGLGGLPRAGLPLWRQRLRLPVPSRDAAHRPLALDIAAAGRRGMR